MGVLRLNSVWVAAELNGVSLHHPNERRVEAVVHDLDLVRLLKLVLRSADIRTGDNGRGYIRMAHHLYALKVGLQILVLVGRQQALLVRHLAIDVVSTVDRALRA